MTNIKFYCLVFLLMTLNGCTKKSAVEVQSAIHTEKIRLIIDTDANNELDDQHALAYAFTNREVFDVEGVTLNNTLNGDGIEGQYKEALRVMELFNVNDVIPLFKGATKSFSEILPDINDLQFDGNEAVDFIIQQAKSNDKRQLVLLPLGKLTNIALALQKAPEIKDRIKIIWLGSNYPEAGEYNLENDTTAVNPVIRSGAAFEMVMVRYGTSSGTDAVKVTRQEIAKNMTGKGGLARHTITGRHGGEFNTFGDYSVNLFEHAQVNGDPPSRALFDMAAIAIVKNPTWATRVEVSAPSLSGNRWIQRPANKAKIWIWENFDRDRIVQDFFESMNRSQSEK